MSKTKTNMQEKVNGYVLVNPVKVARAKLIAKDADSLLVEYDRMFGLILDGEGNKVKSGTFCNPPKDPVVENAEEVAEPVVEPVVDTKKRGRKSKNA